MHFKLESAEMEDRHRLNVGACEDMPAAEVAALFCSQIRTRLGAFAAALDGLHTFLFAGGIGEYAPTIRARVCHGPGSHGIELEEKRYATNDGEVSSTARLVHPCVIQTHAEC